MADNSPIECYFTLHGINYKNGFVTSCPQNPDHLYKIKNIVKPSEIFNSEGFRKHRLEMMSGNWSKGCHLCKEPESVGSVSMRTSYKPEVLFYEHTPKFVKEFNRETMPGETWPKGLKHIELRFNNSCNMACRHCSTVYSSGWVSKIKNYVPDKEVIHYDLKQLLKTEHKDALDISTGQLEITMEQVKEIVDDLCEYAIGLERVEFAGGEVLNQKQFFYFLKLLANHPIADQLTISFHTNFNVNFDPKELHELLSPFGNTIINISVDAGKNIYPYFRTGDWEKLKSNIDKFREYNIKATLIAIITTSAYQIMDLQNIFSSLLEIDFDSITSSIVYSPIYLNPALMSYKFKNHIISDIEETFKIIEAEENRRHTNKETYRRSWKSDPTPSYCDINDAKTALNEIKIYTLNTDLEDYSQNLGHTSILSQQEIFRRFEVYIRKTDEIWQQNFNDFMVNYKFINGYIERVK